jgi:excisionase family DNA binding protein
MLQKAKLDQALAMVREVIEGQGPKVLDARWNGRSTFDVDETAEILGISRWSAYRGIKTGDIPAMRVGKRFIVPRHALEKKLGA